MKTEATGFQWDETEPHSQYGDGISHPSKGARTKMYSLLVRGAQMPAMKVRLHAETKQHALRYGKARWPGAVIEAVE